jgi:hypothetical protein
METVVISIDSISDNLSIVKDSLLNNPPSGTSAYEIWNGWLNSGKQVDRDRWEFFVEKPPGWCSFQPGTSGQRSLDDLCHPVLGLPLST